MVINIVIKIRNLRKMNKNCQIAKMPFKMRILNLLVQQKRINKKSKSSRYQTHKATTYTLMTQKQKAILKS